MKFLNLLYNKLRQIYLHRVFVWYYRLSDSITLNGNTFENMLSNQSLFKKNYFTFILGICLRHVGQGTMVLFPLVQIHLK